MNQLLDLLTNSLDSRSVSRLGDQLGASPDRVQSATQAALPLLLGALQRNAASAGGASALAGALDRDHDGSVLDDVAGFFGKSPTGSEVRSLDHIFGGRRANVESALSRASGLQSDQITQLLAQLAPLVLGALAKTRASSGGGSAGLGDLLGGAVGQLQGGNRNLGGALAGLLDADGDGSVVDDLLGKVTGGGGGGLGGMLGGLLGGKR